MKEQNLKGWKCDHCDYVSLDRKDMEKHENAHKTRWRVFTRFNCEFPAEGDPNEILAGTELHWEEMYAHDIQTMPDNMLFSIREANGYLGLCMHVRADTEEQAVLAYMKTFNEFYRTLFGNVKAAFSRFTDKYPALKKWYNEEMCK